MKFSDMMGPDDEATDDDAEAAVATDSGAPPVPPLTRPAPALDETPVRFGGTRSALDEAVADLTGSPAPVTEPPRAFGRPPGVPPLPAAPAPVMTEPVAEAGIDEPGPEAEEISALEDEPIMDRTVMHDLAAELGTRTQTFVELTGAADQLDATSWLEGLGSIDDDLLPR